MRRCLQEVFWFFQRAMQQTSLLYYRAGIVVLIVLESHLLLPGRACSCLRELAMIHRDPRPPPASQRGRTALDSHGLRERWEDHEAPWTFFHCIRDGLSLLLAYGASRQRKYRGSMKAQTCASSLGAMSSQLPFTAHHSGVGVDWMHHGGCLQACP